MLSYGNLILPFWMPNEPPNFDILLNTFIWNLKKKILISNLKKLVFEQVQGLITITVLKSFSDLSKIIWVFN